MLRVRLLVQQMPPDHQGGYDLAQNELSAEGSTYEVALADARRLVPERWRVIAIDVDR